MTTPTIPTAVKAAIRPALVEAVYPESKDRHHCAFLVDKILTALAPLWPSTPTPDAARLAAAIESAWVAAYAAPELNMANYDHEQVRKLNDGMVEVFTLLDAARQTPPTT